MLKKIWIFVEHRNGEISENFYELSYLAKHIARCVDGEIAAVIIGSDITKLADQITHHNIKNIYKIDDPILGEYSTEIYTSVLVDMVKKKTPSVFLFPSTWMGMDVSPQVSAALGCPMVSKCVNVFVDSDGKLILVRRDIGDRVEKHIIGSDDRCLFASVLPGVFPKEKTGGSGSGTVFQESLDLEGKVSRVKTLSSMKDMTPHLGEAEVVVAAGRGVDNIEMLTKVETLAKTMGAAMGVSRPLVDAGWKPLDDLVGITGKTISPKLYLAFGISGAIQHMMGMYSSQNIIAVNKDSSAPIMKLANIPVKGDVQEIVPLLMRRLKDKYDDLQRLKEEGNSEDFSSPKIDSK